MNSNSVYNNLKEFLAKSQSLRLQKSNSLNIVCSRLEPHWRSNKSLPAPFVVLVTTPVPEGTLVTVAAGNDEAPCAEVRNEVAKVNRQVARFNDLRFVGKSGRGKNFNLTITIHSQPMMVAVVPRAIKVTVDGPRDARPPKAEPCRKRQHFLTPSPTAMPMFPTTPQMSAMAAIYPFFPLWPQLMPRVLPHSPEEMEPLKKKSRKCSPPIWRPINFD